MKIKQLQDKTIFQWAWPPTKKRKTQWYKSPFFPDRSCPLQVFLLLPRESHNCLGSARPMRGEGEGWDGIPHFFHTLLAFWILWARKSFSLEWNGLSWPRATLRRVHWCEQASDQPYIGPPHQITRPENQKDCGARKHFVSVGLSTFSTIFLGLLWLLASYRGAFFIFILVYFSAHDFIVYIITIHIYTKVKTYTCIVYCLWCQTQFEFNLKWKGTFEAIKEP